MYLVNFLGERIFQLSKINGKESVQLQWVNLHPLHFILHRLGLKPLLPFDTNITHARPTASHPPVTTPRPMASILPLHLWPTVLLFELSTTISYHRCHISWGFTYPPPSPLIIHARDKVNGCFCQAIALPCWIPTFLDTPQNGDRKY